MTTIRTRPLEPRDSHLLQEGQLKGASFTPCPLCGHRDVKAYGLLLVCAVCEHVFWRPES